MVQKWINGTKNGDENSFRSIISLYKNDVYRFCYHLLQEPEDSADLTQETFITAFNKIALYKPIGSFKSWLFTIAYRRFLNMNQTRQRREAATPYIEEEFAYLAKLNMETLENDSDTNNMIRCAIERLDPIYRYPLMMRYQEGLSPEEIAKALSISELAVKTRLYRGKRLFGKIMEFLMKVRIKNEV